MSATGWFVIAIIGFVLAGIALVAAIVLFFFFNIPSVIGDLTGKTVAREVKAMRAQSLDSNQKYHASTRISNTPAKNTLPVSTLTQKPSIDKAEDFNSHSKESAKSYRPDVSSMNISTDVLRTDSIYEEATDVLYDGGDIYNSEVISSDLHEYSDDNSTTVLSDSTTVLSDSTTVLSDSTTVLSDSTTVLSDSTTVLSDSTTVLSDSTTVLSDSTTVLSDSTTVLSDSTTVLSDSTTVLSNQDVNSNHAGVTFEIAEERIIIHTEEVIT